MRDPWPPHIGLAQPLDATVLTDMPVAADLPTSLTRLPECFRPSTDTLGTVFPTPVPKQPRSDVQPDGAASPYAPTTVVAPAGEGPATGPPSGAANGAVTDGTAG